MPTVHNIPIGLGTLGSCGTDFSSVFAFDAISCVHDPTRKLLDNDICLLPIPPIMQVLARGQAIVA
jgi:hypothetical protein